MYQFLGVRFPLYWSVITGGALVWLGLTAATDFSFMTESLPLYLYNGAVFMWAGLHWLRRFRKEGNLNLIIGIVFLLWGLHKWNYPFLRGVDSFAPWGYLLASLFATIVALGIILVYYEVNRRLLKESAFNSELLSDELYESREMFKALVEFTEAIH